MQFKTLVSEAQGKSKEVIGFLNKIIDADTFVENDIFVRNETTLGDDAIGEGVCSGFAYINDIQVGIFAFNDAVLKGSVGKKNALKIVKCVNNAVKTDSPIVGVIDTMGARFGEGMDALEAYGEIFAAFSKAYGKVPVALIIKGSNYGMLSYLTAVSDICIAYDKASMASSSPLILASTTKVDTQKVGVAAIHSANGNYSAVVKTDAEAKKLLGNYLSLVCDTISENKDDANRVCKGLKRGIALNSVLNEVLDKGTFIETKSAFATEVVTGFAKLGGYSVGIVANNGSVDEGKLTADSAAKITDLLSVCENFHLPVVNFVDCKGVVSDLTKENGGLIREIGNLIYSYNNVSSAKIALIIGNAIGAGYVTFASKSVCDYSIAWSDASVGVMDSLAAAQLVYADDIAKAKNKDKAATEMAKVYSEENCSAVAASKDGHIDNVIDPNLSRQYLIAAVQMFFSKE